MNGVSGTRLEALLVRVVEVNAAEPPGRGTDAVRGVAVEHAISAER